MKKINLKRFEKRGSKYFLSLGNGTIHEFASQKKAKKFLADTNTFLTRKLYDLREVYIILWNEYQNNWCYFIHDKKTMNVSFYEKERTILRLLSESQKLFDLTVTRSHFENGNHFAFTQLLRASLNLRESLKQLIPLFKSQSNTMKIYLCDGLLTRLINNESEITNYGYIAAVSYFNSGTIQQSFKQSKLKSL